MVRPAHIFFGFRRFFLGYSHMRAPVKNLALIKKTTYLFRFCPFANGAGPQVGDLEMLERNHNLHG